MDKNSKALPLGLSKEEKDKFTKHWNSVLETRLENPERYGLTTLSAINVIQDNTSDLYSLGRANTIADTRLISKDTLLGANKPDDDIYLTEDDAIMTVLKSVAFGLDFGNSSNYILELDSIASYVPRDNFKVLRTVNNASDLQYIGNDEIIACVESSFNLSPNDHKTVIRADYISSVQGDSPYVGKFLVGDFNPDNVTLRYSVNKVVSPTEDGSYLFSVVLSAVLSIKHPEDIYVVQVPFLHKVSD